MDEVLVRLLVVAVLGVVAAAGSVPCFGHDDLGCWALCVAVSVGGLGTGWPPCWGLLSRGWPEGGGSDGLGSSYGVPDVGAADGLSACEIVPLEPPRLDLLEENLVG